ncbi:DUF262 domain-containing protein [Actinobacillus genomosp. 1]|uniref:DUF262 domain-containing protein n=1 Tax=Actinobacillus genomosp. 1 TaxID=254839 RepID=UPI002442B629|nr:DUF262 domain-containing protein [Actinobacillus genomosp. 1]WGE33633.1 DUF262 domain-containing protein [Actinobacillus genomosp. 1]
MLDIEKVEQQILNQQKTVDFDTREFTIELLVDKYSKGLEKEENELYVPDYQREFVWDEVRQSRLIESVILGLPIPIIFVAENKDGKLEIVDGSQRIRTLSSFIKNELKLEGLEKLDLLNGLKYIDLSTSRKRKFNNTAIRMIVLSENTTEVVKNDLFERINRGSDLLLSMEKRKGIYKGDFIDFIYKKCAKVEDLNKLAPLSKVVEKRQEHEELILRFFALSDNYPKYKTQYQGISSYLDKYVNEKNNDFNEYEKNQKFKDFTNMLRFVKNNFKLGFLKGGLNQGVSRVFFEAISVGVHLALKEQPSLLNEKVNVQCWVTSSEFKNIVSGKQRTHTPDKILQRINFVKDKLLKK